MAWLLRDGVVLASLEIADTRATRRKGLLGKEGVDGALLIRPARSVHSFGMRFPLDVAWCDRSLHVVRVAELPPHRMTRSVFKGHSVIEAEAGAFARWGLAVGDELEIRAGD